METKTGKAYKVSEETAKFIDALEAFEKAKSLYYDALVNQYGQERADSRAEENDSVFEELEGRIFQDLNACMRAAILNEEGEI